MIDFSSVTGFPFLSVKGNPVSSSRTGILTSMSKSGIYVMVGAGVIANPADSLRLAGWGFSRDTGLPSGSVLMVPSSFFSTKAISPVFLSVGSCGM